MRSTGAMALSTAAAAAILCVLVVCGAPAAAAAVAEGVGEVGHVTGTLSYAGNRILPAGAVVTVSVRDVSIADAEAPLIGQVVYTADGKANPSVFDVPYAVADVSEGPLYSASARAEARGRLWYVTDTVHHVLTHGAAAEGVELKLKEVRRRGGVVEDEYDE